MGRVFGLCRDYVCDSGLHGGFPIAQGAAPGLGRPSPLNWPTAIDNVALGNAQGKTPAENHGFPLPRQRSGITNTAFLWVTTRAEAHATTTEQQFGDDAEAAIS